MIGMMPIYDHRCDHCGHAFSVVRSYSDPPVEECPSCGKRPRRVVGAPAIVFKGSGWYKTDSRAAAGGDEAKSRSDAKAETKAAEPSAKPETKASDKGSGAASGAAS